MDFWAQFWATMWGALAGALVGGGASALIAWRTFVGEREARKGDRVLARADAAADLKRAHYDAVLALLTRMFEMVSTSTDVGRATALNTEFFLAVNQMTSGESKLDRDRFRYWQMDIGESFVAMVEWPAPEWRARTDEFGPMVTVASGQLEAWFAGEGTDLLLLDRQAAKERFTPDWTDQSIGRLR
jgi:hypothetical protein